jgi:Flp pilus assembly pilin Flp
MACGDLRLSLRFSAAVPRMHRSPSCDQRGAISMRQPITRFFRETRGSAMLEYSLILAVMGMCVVSAISTLGDVLGDLYRAILAGVTAIAGFIP